MFSGRLTTKTKKLFAEYLAVSIRRNFLTGKFLTNPFKQCIVDDMKNLKIAFNYILKQKYFFIVLLGMLIYTVIFSAICLWKYNSFSHIDFDFAIHLQKYWNILHGSPRASIIDNTTIWGNAIEIIAYPFSLLYALFFCSPQAMLIIKVIILAAGAMPIFLIGRHAHSPRLGAAFAVSYLLYPALWFLALFEYFDLVLAGLTLLWAFYCLKTDRFWWYITCILLTIACRLDMTLVTLMIGIYAALDKKPWRWSILPITISLVWLYLGIFVFLPHFRTGVNYEQFYAYLGKDFPEIFKNILTRPSILFQPLLQEDNGYFILQILMPAGFFSLFALKELMICALNILQHLLSTRIAEHSIVNHYTIAMTPFIYISAIYGLLKFSGGNLPRRIFSYIIILPIISNIIYGPIHSMNKELVLLLRENTAKQKQRLIAMIPKNAAVVSTFEFLSHLSNRRYLYAFHYIYQGELRPGVPYAIPDNIEYALIDFNDIYTTIYFRKPDSDLNMRRFLEGNNWQVIDFIDSIALFKKNHPGNKKLYEIIPAKIRGFDKTPSAALAGKISLQDYNYSPVKAGGTTAIKFSFTWRCLNPNDNTLGMLIRLVDQNGKTRYETIRQLCYGIYPTQRWQKDETINDYYIMTIPGYLPKGKYALLLTLASMDRGTFFTFDQKISQKSINPDGSVAIGEIVLPIRN